MIIKRSVEFCHVPVEELSPEALEDVRSVEMEWHGRESEADASQQQRECHQQHGVRRERRGFGSDGDEVCGASKSEDPRESVEDEGGRENTEQEILDGSFAGHPVAASHIEKDICGNADHFEAEEDTDEVIGEGDEVGTCEDGEQAGKGFGGVAVFGLVPDDECQQDAGNECDAANVPGEGVRLEGAERIRGGG